MTQVIIEGEYSTVIVRDDDEARAYATAREIVDSIPPHVSVWVRRMQDGSSIFQRMTTAMMRSAVARLIWGKGSVG